MTRTATESEVPIEVASKEESESFGTWLRRQREMREITLREIADTSKISLRYLQALEDDRFDLLPAQVFAKGFLRQYARYVGIDTEETVNFYLSAQAPAAEEAEEELKSRRARTVGTWPYALAVLVVAVLLMGIVWLLLRLNQAPGEAPGDIAAPPHEDGAESPQADPPAPGASQAGTAPPSSPSAAPGEDARESSESAPAPAALRVTLDFRGDCWVRTNVDGAPRQDRVYTQGESLQIRAGEWVEFELGNAQAVDVEVNGTPMEIDDGSGNPVRRLTIDRETAAALEAGTFEGSE